MRRDIEYASSVLTEAAKVRQDPQVRFERAVRLRSEMRQAISAGNPPRDHYRYQWLLRRAQDMVAVLRGWSREFDAEHPDDTATLLDVFDVVNTARLVLMREMREMGLQFEEDAARQPESPAEAEE